MNKIGNRTSVGVETDGPVHKISTFVFELRARSSTWVTVGERGVRTE